MGRSSDLVAPGGTLAYTATVENKLDAAVARGLLQAEFPIDQVQSTRVLAALRPLAQTSMTGSVQTPSATQTEYQTFTVRAGAVIEPLDRTNRVLWLHFNEKAGSTLFVDDALSAGGPHNATCVAANCPDANGLTANFSYISQRDVLSIPDHAEFSVTGTGSAGEQSVAFWVRPTANNQVVNVKEYLWYDPNGIHIYRDGDGLVVKMGQYETASSSTLPLNQRWQPGRSPGLRLQTQCRSC